MSSSLFSRLTAHALGALILTTVGHALAPAARTSNPTANEAELALPRLPPSPRATTDSRAVPHVLLILADDLGVDRLGCYGGTSDGQHPRPGRTPNIDCLAERGVRFTNVWASPVCSVARGTILGGRHASRTGLGGNIRPDAKFGFPPSEASLPRLLHLAEPTPYRSVAIGKWHLGSTAQGESHPLDSGFDSFVGNMRGLGRGYYDPIGVVDGERTQRKGYATTLQIDAAIRAFQEAEGPLFCYLSVNAPHTPIHRPPRELHSYDLPDDPDFAPREYVRAMIEALDTELGRLFDSIGPDVLARTLVIFIGDNGTADAATDPPFDHRHAKGTAYQGGIHVPLVIAGPGVIEGGRTCDALVQALDLHATILEVAGLAGHAALADEPATDSLSLVSQLVDPAAPGRRHTLYAERFHPLGSTLPEAKDFEASVREERYKLIRRYDKAASPHVQEEMYDLFLDPLERLDLLRGSPSEAERDAYVRLHEEFWRMFGIEPL